MLYYFVNRVLRKITGLKGKEGAGGWRSLHNKELHNLNTSPKIISDQIKDEMVGM
jgi:hypothetical protein